MPYCVPSRAAKVSARAAPSKETILSASCWSVSPRFCAENEVTPTATRIPTIARERRSSIRVKPFIQYELRMDTNIRITNQELGVEMMSRALYSYIRTDSLFVLYGIH